jgi:phage-related baseplate assembly protein
VLDASATGPQPDDIKALVLGVLADHAAPADLVAAMTSALDTARWPGSVVVSVLARTGDGTAPAELIDTVAAYVSDETRRPLTDWVTVQSARIVPYAVDATLTTFSGPDGGVVLAAAQASLDAYTKASHRLGRDITRSAIFAALSVEGVQNVILREPAQDIVISASRPLLHGHVGRLCRGRGVTASILPPAPRRWKRRSNRSPRGCSMSRWRSALSGRPTIARSTCCPGWPGA